MLSVYLELAALFLTSRVALLERAVEEAAVVCVFHKRADERHQRKTHSKQGAETGANGEFVTSDNSAVLIYCHSTPLLIARVRTLGKSATNPILYFALGTAPSFRQEQLIVPTRVFDSDLDLEMSM